MHSKSHFVTASSRISTNEYACDSWNALLRSLQKLLLKLFTVFKTWHKFIPYFFFRTYARSQSVRLSAHCFSGGLTRKYFYKLVFLSNLITLCNFATLLPTDVVTHVVFYCASTRVTGRVHRVELNTKPLARWSNIFRTRCLVKRHFISFIIKRRINYFILYFWHFERFMSLLSQISTLRLCTGVTYVWLCKKMAATSMTYSSVKDRFFVWHWLIYLSVAKF